jgi:hypothetical protein
MSKLISRKITVEKEIYGATDTHCGMCLFLSSRRGSNWHCTILDKALPRDAKSKALRHDDCKKREVRGPEQTSALGPICQRCIEHDMGACDGGHPFEATKCRQFDNGALIGSDVVPEVDDEPL